MLGTTANPVAGHAPNHAPPKGAVRFLRVSEVRITDQYDNRVIEVDPVTPQIVWSFRSGSLCNPGPDAIVRPHGGERPAEGLNLIAGTGIPSGIPHATGCADSPTRSRSPGNP